MTGTIQTMVPRILKKGETLRNVLVQLPKWAQQWKMYQYNFSLSTKTLAITTVFLFFFFFFLLSLFAPLNGIQHIEDTSDTHCQFFLPTFCALRAQFPCDTALPTWRFCLGTLALTTGSLRPKIGWNKFPPLQCIPS